LGEKLGVFFGHAEQPIAALLITVSAIDTCPLLNQRENAQLSQITQAILIINNRCVRRTQLAGSWWTWSYYLGCLI